MLPVLFPRRALTVLPGAWLLPCVTHAQITDLNEAINKAGRQRMLSQRLSLAWLAIGQDVETERARRMRDDSLALFERQLVELKAFAPSVEIRATYTALEPLWQQYKIVLQTHAPSPANGPTVVALGNRVLALAHQGTLQIERFSGKNIGRLVNKAGRQRMLSQLLAKLYFVQRWQLAQPTQEIDAARQEFQAGMKFLREAPEATPAIRQELTLADQQWLFFDGALQRQTQARDPARDASDVLRSSDHILQVMERVTSLYARLPS